MGKSKFEVMQNTTEKQESLTSKGIDDQIRKKQLENQLESIDLEIKQNIKDIESTPIDKELLTADAKANLQRSLKANEQEMVSMIEKANLEIEEAKLEVEKAKLALTKQVNYLNKVKEEANSQKELDNISSQREYNKVLASIDNTQQTIENLKDKARLDGKKRKEAIEIELMEIEAREKAQETIKTLHQKLYDDVKTIGLKQAEDTK